MFVHYGKILHVAVVLRQI